MKYSITNLTTKEITIISGSSRSNLQDLLNTVAEPLGVCVFLGTSYLLLKYLGLTQNKFKKTD